MDKKNLTGKTIGTKWKLSFFLLEGILCQK
jgi:hypothetical protein